jgi:prepilin signal peptidase PulO-like enzyme (type II secretory pathway)
MLPLSFSEMILLAGLTGLGLYVLREDLREMEIPALPVFLLTALAVAFGIFFPLAGSPVPPGFASAAVGGLIGLGLSAFVRLYTTWRVGAPAFGGADILLIAGGGAMLGPVYFGPWLLAACIIALLLAFIGPALARRRETEIEGETLRVIPFCPALLVSWALTWALARTGQLAFLVG